MAEEKSSQAVTQPTEPSRGDFYLPGQPVPPGFRPTAWIGQPVMTLERKAREGFDPDLLEKVQRELDKAYVRSFSNPTTELPDGQRPYMLIVNDEFDRLMPDLESYGDSTLQPPCRVRRVDNSDSRFKEIGTISIGKVKAFFDTRKPERR